MYSTRRDKSVWVLVLMMLAGVVLGGFLGEFVGGFPYFGWLRFGSTFGFENPILLNLEVIKLQFGIVLEFTIASIIGMVLAILLYRRM